MLKVVGASWSQIRLSSWIIGIVILLGIVAIIVTETGISNDDGNYSATVYWTEELGYAIDFWGQGNKLEEIPKGVARAHYDPHITETGWAIFQVETQPEFSDQTQAYAAGLLEGALTWQMIYWHWLNTVNSYCEDKQLLCDSIRRFLKTNKDWAWKTAKDRREDPYWHQVYLYYVQLAGIENGYQQGVKRSRQDVEEVLSTDFLWMNMFSDLEDLEQAFSNNLLFMESLNYSSAEEWIEQKREKKLDTFNCGYRQIPLSSAFVKILPETGKLFVGHNSAGPYSRMLKMMKRYSLPYHHSDEPDSPLVSGTNLVFSSYPAAIHSMDDFYVISGSMGHNLVVAATPLPVYNEQLWQHVSETNTLLLGPRSLASNRLGRDSGNWASIFNHYNSGTGNKAWFVVNMGHFEKVLADTSNTNRLASLKNLLWVVEQIPGKIEASDVTEALLSSTYWAGYGIPYHNSIFNKSGALLMANEHGSAFSYNETALAKIFRRDQANVTSMDSAVNLMRSNLYRVDPLSEGNPRCAVGSRGDVSSEAEAAEPEGVTDIKVIRADAPIPYALKAALHNSTERVLWKTPRLRIAAGPVFGGTTTDGELDDLEPFSWSAANFSDVSHVGQPDTWMFEPIYLPFV